MAAAGNIFRGNFGAAAARRRALRMNAPVRGSLEPPPRSGGE